MYCPHNLQPVFADILLKQQIVYESGMYNFESCRIPVGSKFHIPLWKFLLVDYHDRQIIDLLEFGFPIDFTGAIVLED